MLSHFPAQKIIQDKNILGSATVPEVRFPFWQRKTLLFQAFFTFSVCGNEKIPPVFSPLQKAAYGLLLRPDMSIRSIPIDFNTVSVYNTIRYSCACGIDGILCCVIGRDTVGFGITGQRYRRFCVPMWNALLLPSANIHRIAPFPFQQLPDCLNNQARH